MKNKSAWVRQAAVVFALLAAGVPAAAEAGQVIVHIQGVRSDQGLVRIGVYGQDSAFPRSGRVAGQEIAAHRGDVVVTFEDLAPGVYAIAIHHDEDGDGEFDTTLIGLPSEGYGFSNDAPVVFGPPDFDSAAIDVRDDGATTALSVRY